MSGFGGGAPVGAAGGGGWAQSGSATQGFTNYGRPRGRPRQLLPELASSIASPGPGRAVARPRPGRATRASHPLLEGNHAMTIDRYRAITEALRKTVTQTVAAGGDAELLNKAFADFQGALDEQLADDLPLQPGEVDPITAATDGLQKLADTAAAIEAGECQPIADLQPSAESVALLHAAVDLGEIALRAMATDFAAPLEKGEAEGEGEALAKLALGEGEGAEEVLVKTVLPEGPRSLLVHPALLGAALADLGADLMAVAGVDLSPLAKAAPPFAKKKKGDEDPEAGEEEPEDEGGEEPEDDGEEDPEEEGADVPEAMDDPLENIAKLATAIVVEVGALREMMGPAAPPAMPAPQPQMDANGQPMDGPEGGEGMEGGQGGGDPVVSAIEGMGKLAALIATMADSLQRAAGEPDAGPAEEAAEKAAAAGELAKRAVKEAEVSDELRKAREEIEAVRAQVEALAKQNRDKDAQIAQLREAPVDGKAVVGAGTGTGPVALRKEAPVAFDADAASAELEELAKMTPEEQSAALFKRALRNPIVS